jgi:hypothetical protein
MEEIEIPTEHLQETIQEKVEEEFKREEKKSIVGRCMWPYQQH